MRLKYNQLLTQNNFHYTVLDCVNIFECKLFKLQLVYIKVSYLLILIYRLSLREGYAAPDPTNFAYRKSFFISLNMLYN